MHVGVLIILGLGLGADHREGLAVQDDVVHLSEAALEFVLSVELEVAVAERAGSAVVENNFCLLDAVAAVGEELFEIEVEEVLVRKTLNLEGGDLVLSLSDLLSCLLAGGRVTVSIEAELSELLRDELHIVLGLLLIATLHGVGRADHHVASGVTHRSAHHHLRVNHHLRRDTLGDHHLCGDHSGHHLLLGNLLHNYTVVVLITRIGECPKFNI